jgi:hypothetical protein
MLKRIFESLKSLLRPLILRRLGRPPCPAPVPGTALARISLQAAADQAQLPCAERLGQLRDLTASALSCALRPGEEGPPRARPSLRGRWKKDMADLAMICVDMLLLDRDLFPGLPVTSQGLAGLVDEERMLTEMAAIVADLLNKLKDLLRARRDELCTHTQMIVDTAASLSAAPLLTDEQRDRVKLVAGPILDHVNKRNGKVRQVRQHNRHVKKWTEAKLAEAQQELAVAQAENQVLRGGSIKDVRE